VDEIPAPSPSRRVYCADAVRWLETQPTLTGCSVVTSLPDVSETQLSLERWEAWFVGAASLTISRCPEDAVAIFFQSDIKKNGRWVDKGYLCQRGAEAVGARLLWHKIVCRVPPGTVTFGRAAYAHLLCFSRGQKLDLARSTADVLAEPGRMVWTRAIGLDACRLACRYVRDHTRCRTIVDPFCGWGTVLAVANALGLDAIGVELNARRARKARGLAI
jgi:hypothetical protein